MNNYEMKPPMENDLKKGPVCWYCETRSANGGWETVYVSKVSDIHHTGAVTKTYYENKAVLIPRCKKCNEEKETLRKLFFEIKNSVKASAPRPKYQLLYLLGMLLGVLAIILIVVVWGTGQLVVLIPIVLILVCLMLFFISIEQRDHQINKLVEAQLNEYKTTHGFLYREKDSQTFPEVVDLLKGPWQYGHSGGTPVSLGGLPPPVY